MIIFGVLVLLNSCAYYPGPHGLASNDASEKIPAMKRAADAHDTSAIPAIVKALASDDPAVRFYAIQSLRRLTGHTFDYRFYASYEERREAIGRWQRWLAEQSATQRSDIATASQWEIRG